VQLLARLVLELVAEPFDRVQIRKVGRECDKADGLGQPKISIGEIKIGNVQDEHMDKCRIPDYNLTVEVARFAWWIFSARRNSGRARPRPTAQ
jgi:hypothetical protein